MNSAIFSPSGGSVGIGFAISSNLAKQVVADLEDDGKVERGWLGVQIQGRRRGPRGRPAAGQAAAAPWSARSQPDSPAAPAGVKQGDVVLVVRRQADRAGRRSSAGPSPSWQPGKKAELDVWRDGKEKTLEVDVGEMPAQDQVAAPSRRARTPISRELGPGAGAADAGAARAAGPRQGRAGRARDPGRARRPGRGQGHPGRRLILSIDRKPVREPKDVVAAIRKAHETGAKSVLLYVSRDGNERFEAVPLATS